MIKKCKVLNYNQHQNILVADFDGIQIQLTCKRDMGLFCYLKKDKNCYTLVSENEFKKEQQIKKKVNIEENNKELNKNSEL